MSNNPLHAAYAQSGRLTNLKRALAGMIIQRFRLFRSLLLLTVLLGGCGEKPKLTTTSSEARRHYDEGVVLLEKFYFVEAKAALQQATTLDSNFAMAYARLALLYARSGNEDSARIQSAIAVRKSVSASRYEQLFIRMLDHEVRFRFQDALRVADSLTSLYPDNAEGYVFLGDLLEMNKKADRALDMYKKAVNVDPNYAPAVMSLGYAYSTRGKTSEAIQAMERYVRLVPDAADPRASFGDILFRSGRYNEALEQYTASLQFKPDYWYSINRIGDVYALLGRLRDAERQYEMGMASTIATTQTRANHIALKADMHLRRGKYAEALSLFDHALSLDSTGLRAAFGRVHALLKLKQTKAASQLLPQIRMEIERRNLGASSVMLQYHLLGARLLQEQGMLDEALAVCDSAMEFGTELTRTDVYHQMALIYLAKQDYEAALDALDEALRYNPNHPQALLTLTRVYKASGDERMTREIANRLLEMWKNADADFQSLRELKQVLAGGSSPAQS